MRKRTEKIVYFSKEEKIVKTKLGKKILELFGYRCRAELIKNKVLNKNGFDPKNIMRIYIMIK